MNRQIFKTKLSKYLPEQALDYAVDLCFKPDLQITVAKTRKTKLGDYRSPINERDYHRISINHDLNPYSFLITLIHEVAHYECTKTHGRSVKPHGNEWKMIYSTLLQPVVNEKVFPRNILIALKQHLSNPKAASCSDPKLNLALSEFDANPSTRLQDLEDGEVFCLDNGRVFIRGHKRRTRFVCTELQSHKKFLISGLARVTKKRV